MLCDQLVQNLKLLLKERTPKILNNMAELADQYKDARDLTVNQVTQTGKSKTLQKKPNSDVKWERTEPKDKNNSFVPRNKRDCYKYHKLGHIAPECRSNIVVV